MKPQQHAEEIAEEATEATETTTYEAPAAPAAPAAESNTAAASTVSGSEAEAKEWIAQKESGGSYTATKRTLHRTLPIDRFILER